jgi:hypothetical protein
MSGIISKLIVMIEAAGQMKPLSQTPARKVEVA